MTSIAETPTTLTGRTSPKRKATDVISWTLSFLGLAVIIAPAVWIIVQVLSTSIPGWQWSIFTQLGSGLGGGLENEILGTVVIVFGVALFAGTIGILSGLYLAEYGDNKMGSILRGASEVLAGIPSIVMGYVGYIALVVYFHWGYSLGAGLIVLSVMVVPYVAKSTEVSLRRVPTGYIEGAEALGFKSTYILTRITLKNALPGISTGIIIATAIAIGETAPLLYTAGYSEGLPPLALTHHPIGYLTYAVWTFYNQPSKSAHQLSFDAATLLIAAVILLIVIARAIVASTQKHSEGRR